LNGLVDQLPASRGACVVPARAVSYASSLIAEKMDSLRDATHRQRFLEGLDDGNHRADESGPGAVFGCRSQKNERGRGVFASARHISSPWDDETTLGCTPADRAVVASPNHGSLGHRWQFTFGTRTWWELKTSPKSPRPITGQRAVLGRYALGRPGDCGSSPAMGIW
jgi:hypothetical protein